MTESQSAPKVLLVDDAPENIRMLRNLLRDDANLLFATSGEDALMLARTEQPDLILLDVLMPGLDGYEVCQRLKSEPVTQGIPVIFVTGLTEETDESRGLELGAIDYITKPFAPGIVRMRVQNHLALCRVTRELQQANGELKRLATTDALTGVSNRRHFFEQVAEELDRMRRYGHAASMFMIDLDHFKRLNDTYGHDVGDQALVRVAAEVRQTLRGHDLFARMGGEEFAGFLPETNIDSAILVCERLRERIAAIELASSTGTVKITGSIGVAAVETGDETPEISLKRADLAMYEAKTSGRNAVRRG
jgi:diguanylate cyclase (GGDEF)-like protein